MVMCLEDLINYFAQPEEDMGKKIDFFTDFFLKNNNLYLSILKSTKKNKTDSEH